jgi:tetratricopeptide (TPR) repeat protein
MEKIERAPQWIGAFRRHSVWGVALLLAFVLLQKVGADEFDSGNQVYEQGKFAEARQEYERRVKSGATSANLFYNLGNTDYRLGSVGRAMLNYERALALNPRHPEARANLQLLYQQSGAKMLPASWIGKIAASQAADFWLIIAVATGWVMLFVLAFIFTNRRSGNGGSWCFALANAAVFALALGSLWIGARDQALAIIIVPQTEARLAPAASAGVAEALTAGSRVRVLSERGEWIYCELPGAGRGWIPHDALERLRLERS